MSEETKENLRASIEAAMKDRCKRAIVVSMRDGRSAVASIWGVTISANGDDAEDALRRLHVACGLSEIERLQSELAAARSALRELAPRCKAHDALATRTAGTWRSPQRVCDRHGCELGQPILCESEHAEALRAARRAR